MAIEYVAVPGGVHTPIDGVTSKDDGCASARENVDEEATCSPTRLPVFRIFLLSGLVFAVQFGISLETAYVIPLFAELGITERFSSLLWAMGPIAGLIMQPVIGNASDRCTLRWGRRRPFILALALGAMLGLLFIPNGQWVGQRLGDTDDSHKGAIAICVLGVLLLDFCCDSAMGPLRAYLLDVLPVDQQDLGNSVIGIMAGLGASLGYVAGGVEWGVVGHMLGSQLRAAFTCGLVVAVLCSIATLFSAREKPLLARPRLSQTPSHTPADDTTPLLRDQSLSQPPSHSDTLEERGHVNAREIFAYLLHLPRPIVRICIVNFLGWVAFLSYVIFFTDFVGIELYGGDPTLPEGNEYRDAYDKGVRVGSLGLAAFSIGIVVTSIAVSRLLPRVGVRPLYCACYLCFCVGVGVISLTDSLAVVLAMCFVSGTLFSALFTMPFMCLSAFEAARGSDGRSNGLAVAVVSMMQFLGQVLVSVTMGNVIESVGDVTIAMYSASACSAVGAVATLFLVLGSDLHAYAN